MFGPMPHAALVAVMGLLATQWSADVRSRAVAAAPDVAPLVTIAAPAIEPAPVLAIPGATNDVTGTIVDGAGHPIPGVRVREGEATGITDARGEFHVAAAVADQHTLALDGAQVFAAEVRWRTGDPAPRILLARRARFAAHVTANGAPVAGAEVSLSDGSRPTLVTAATDADGVARFEDLQPGPYELWARRETAVSALVRVGDLGATSQPELTELTLVPGGSIRGQVIAGEALPAGSTITLAPVDVDHAVRVATLDAQGRFAIDGVPRGHWRIAGAAAGYLQSGEQIIDVRGAREEIAVRMARAGVVSGTTLDSAGTPVANATIVLRQQGAAVLDDRPSVMASTRLRWVHPLAGHRFLPGRDVLRFGAPRPGARPAECGGGHCGVDIGSQRGTVIHAAADGEIALAFTEIRGEAGRYVAIDHGDGLRTFYMHMDELRSGLEIGQKVRAGDPLGKMGSTGAADGPHLHFAVTQEREGRTWYIDPEPMLRHAVVLPAARALDAIDGVHVTVIAAIRTPDAGRMPVSQQSAPQSFTTDAHGRFRIDGVAPGKYVAIAIARELAPGTSGAFTVRTGSETGEVAITLHPGVLVQGRVIGRDGPIPGATIVAGASVGESAHTIATSYAAAQGDYTLRALSGAITVTVTAPGYGAVERTLVLDSGGRARREDFTLVIENAQLRGQLLAPDGGPPGAVALRVIDGPTHRRAVTDASGRFTIDHVATGNYVLEASSQDYPAARVTLRSDQFAEVRLERGGSVRCELRDARSGAALAGIRVEAIGPGNQALATVTDARGIAELRALAVGEWTVHAPAKGYTDERQVVTVRPTAVPQEVRLELSRGVTVGGVVRDRYGRRVAGARVAIDGVTTQTDGDGNFRLADAPAGARWIEAELDGARGGVAVQLAPGDERLSLSIDLTP